MNQQQRIYDYMRTHGGITTPQTCGECFAFNREYCYCILFSYGIPARHNLLPYEKPDWCEMGEVKHEDCICLETLENNIEAQMDCVLSDVQVRLPIARRGA